MEKKGMTSREALVKTLLPLSLVVCIAAGCVRAADDMRGVEIR
jgi:hypothetical protein